MDRSDRCVFVQCQVIFPTLRILTPPMETPGPPSDTPGASKQVFLTPRPTFLRILRVCAIVSFFHSAEFNPQGFFQRIQEKITESTSSRLDFTCAMVDQLLVLGMVVFPPLIGILIMGPYKPLLLG